MNFSRFEQLRRLLDRACDLYRDENLVSVVDALDKIEVKLLNLRGSVKVMNGDYDGALHDFDVIQDLEPGTTFHLCERALVKTILGDHVGALMDLENAATKCRNSKWYLGDYEGVAEGSTVPDPLVADAIGRT